MKKKISTEGSAHPYCDSYVIFQSYSKYTTCRIDAGLEIRLFLQSGTAKICAGMARFVISHSDEHDELANLRPS